MNKENKKMAQERRAAERARKKRLAVTRNVAIVLIVVAFFAGMIIFGALESKREKADSNAGQDSSTSQSQDVSEDSSDSDTTLDTDTDREVKDGDTVAVHYAGSVDGIAFDGGTGDYDLVIGSHTFIDDFEEQLIGHKIGETVEVKATFPDGYSATYQDAEGNSHSLSGVEATFEVDIKGIYN